MAKIKLIYKIILTMKKLTDEIKKIFVNKNNMKIIYHQIILFER